MPQVVQRKPKPQSIPNPPPPDPLAPRPKVQQKQVMTGRNGGSRGAHQDKNKVIPQVKDIILEDSDEEEELSFDYIVREKPSPKKVAMFLQECVNEIMKEDDSESETDMNDSEY
jgi:hypothetical protein